MAHLARPPVPADPRRADDEALVVCLCGREFHPDDSPSPDDCDHCVADRAFHEGEAP